MKTYPIYRKDGAIGGFEIANFYVSLWSLRPLCRLIQSVDGVSNVRRQFCNDDRIIFTLKNEKCVVNEPWGDNNRYWIGPEIGIESELDLEPLHDAFQRHQFLIVRLLKRLAG